MNTTVHPAEAINPQAAAKLDGGAAFPRDRLDWSDLQSDRPSLRAAQAGMTLRDYFAAKVFGVAHITLGGNDAGWLGTARLAYTIADAMLEARQAAA